VPNITSGGKTSDAGLDLIARLSSAQSEEFGWNAVVRPSLARAEDVILRLSSTLLRVRLGAFPAYDILQATCSSPLPAAQMCNCARTHVQAFAPPALPCLL